jgi:hypothetical protein
LFHTLFHYSLTPPHPFPPSPTFITHTQLLHPHNRPLFSPFTLSTRSHHHPHYTYYFPPPFFHPSLISHQTRKQTFQGSTYSPQIPTSQHSHSSFLLLPTPSLTTLAQAYSNLSTPVSTLHHLHPPTNPRFSPLNYFSPHTGLATCVNISPSYPYLTPQPHITITHTTFSLTLTPQLHHQHFTSHSLLHSLHKSPHLHTLTPHLSFYSS